MEKFKISKRLQTAAQFVVAGNRVADIGTDHGYLPIYLIEHGISNRVIAMDVRKGPLSKAQNNVAENKMSDKIELRLSDGLEQLEKNEVDTVTICGMGGKLMKQILINGMDRLTDGMQLILSPQSEMAEFRRFLRNNNIHIMNEIMLKEENQYYVIMDCRYNKEQQMAQDRYGRILLEKKDPVLEEVLYRELEMNRNVQNKIIDLEKNESVVSRLHDLKEEEKVILKALKYYN